MTRVTLAALFSVMVISAPAFAQQPAAPAPAAPAAAAPAQATPSAPTAGGGALRMAFVDLQRVASESAEGKVATGKVQALTQKKSAELKDKTSQLQANQQKLQQGGTVLNDAARAQATKEVDRLTVEIDRFQQDANAEVQELQQQLQGEFQEKLRPILDAMVKELKIGLLFSMGDAGAIFVDQSLDITPDVIKRFDAAKPAAPAAPSTAKPAAPAAPSTAKPTTPAPPSTAKPTPPAPPATTTPQAK